MTEKKEREELNQPSTPEIEQHNIVEIEQDTPHPTREDTQVNSEKLRYPNADTLY